MKFHVHHVPGHLLALALCQLTDAQLSRFVRDHRSKYQHVADVEARDIRDVFALTNTIGDLAHEWWGNNPQVILQMMGRHRSTSVGDVISTKVPGLATVLEWIVAPTGFVRVL